MQTQAQLPTKTKWEKHHFLHLPLLLHFAHVKTEETQTKVQRKGKSTGSIGSTPAQLNEKKAPSLSLRWTCERRFARTLALTLEFAPGGGILPIMAYMGRLCPKGEPFSGFRYMKG